MTSTLALLGPLVEPGFLASGPVRTALGVTAVVAVVSAVAGTFTVARGQAFAGHALSDIGTAGGAAAFLVGVPALAGFVAVDLVAAAAMEAIGVRRAAERDLATGVVFGASLGLAALFLYEDTTTTSAAGATATVLFGSVFTLAPGTLTVVAVLGAVTLAVVAVLWRPLLLSSVSPDLAAARRVPVRLVGAAFLGVLAAAVSMSALAIGAVLSTALLVGPPAVALRCTARPARAVGLAAAIGVAASWLGVLVAYDSAVWTGTGWPVSFCIVAIVVVANLVAGRRR